MAVIQEAFISEDIHDLKAEANRKFAAKDYDGALSINLDILAQLPPRQAPEASASAAEDDEQEVPVQAPEKDASVSVKVAPPKEAEEDSTPIPETEEEQQIRLFRSVIYANIAATHLRLGQHRDAVKACNESLIDQPRYVKALYRRAQANEHIGGWAGLSSALDDNKALLKHPDLPASTRPEVEQAMRRLEPKAREAAEKEKDEMIQKLKGLGDSILGNFGLSTNNFKFTQQPGGGYSMNFVR